MEHTRLTVTLRPGHGTLARLAATLNNHHVLDLTYTTAPADTARAVVCVAQSDALRAQHKLRRLVDVIEVTPTPALPDTAETAGVPHTRHPAAGAPCL
ncbi:hypothetical protein EDD98_5727 [Streptomyces sp. PanSC19]|uniref:hypothetical protein n=1 Tax=Streptomyces sp. PanSC19 TaxID=1520455 RepID=UPI000F4AEC6A|nr:hypothetical protein [Streptomyces sp. PanSC19]ROQ26122.1 hypothetical protein EDD98_5727 [Streptomyces sp. PanSC19]